MSTYKQLIRSRSNRMMGGVCGGLGEYLDVDPTILRLAFVLIGLLGYLPVVGVIYLVLLIVVPEQAAQLPPQPTIRPTESMDDLNAGSDEPQI